MFLSGNFLGVSPLIGAIDIIPQVTQYNVFKFHGGNTGATFSKIWGKDTLLTANEINGYTLDSYVNPDLPDGESMWQAFPNTYFYTSFENSLNGGNITGITYAINSWLLYRQEINSNTMEYLATLTPENITYYDFTALNNKTYTYYIFVNDSAILSNRIETLPIKSDYYGWFLVDVENNRAYHFDINLSVGNNSFKDSLTEHKTNNRTNSFSRGSSFSIEGTIEAIVSKNNKKEDIINTNDDLKSLSEFIQSDRPKLLKTRRGELYKVFTYGYQERLLNPSLGENIYISAFNFKEEGDD